MLSLWFGPVASLRWVTPGAATEGVTYPSIFFSWKRPFLVASSAVSSLVSSFFAHRCHYRFLLLSLGCHPSRVGCHLFYLSDLVSALFFVNLPTNLFLRVSPPGGCHPGRSATLVLPSNATVQNVIQYIDRLTEPRPSCTHGKSFRYFKLCASRTSDIQ